jgi:excinuclease ABC subunit A
VVEHALDVIRCADWIVDVGPQAGEGGGEILYSGPPEGLKKVDARTRGATCSTMQGRAATAPDRCARRRLAALEGVTRNNLHELKSNSRSA